MGNPSVYLSATDKLTFAKEMEQKELEVSVYEESVQIQKGNMVFHGYREAWDAYERGGQT